MIADPHNLTGLPTAAENVFQSRSDKAKSEIGHCCKCNGRPSLTQISPEMFPQEVKEKPRRVC